VVRITESAPEENLVHHREVVDFRAWLSGECRERAIECTAAFITTTKGDGVAGCGRVLVALPG
jgi:hypothetical protein